MNLNKTFLILFMLISMSINISAKERFPYAAKGSIAGAVSMLALVSFYKIGNPELNNLLDDNRRINYFRACAALSSLYVGWKLGKYAYDSLNKAFED